MPVHDLHQAYAPPNMLLAVQPRWPNPYRWPKPYCGKQGTAPGMPGFAADASWCCLLKAGALLQAGLCTMWTCRHEPTQACAVLQAALALGTVKRLHLGKAPAVDTRLALSCLPGKHVWL